MRGLISLMLLIVLTTTAAAGQYYKWVDEQGNVHYSDRPPTNAEYQNVEGAAGTPAEDAPTALQRLERWRAEQEARKAKREEKEATEAEARRKQQELEQACATARHNLEILVQSQRILLPPEAEGGEPVRMSDDERMRRIDEIREAIEENCD